MGLHKVPIGRLGIDDFDDFDGRMEAAGRSMTTRAHYFDFISQALNMAVDREWLDRNPIHKMKGSRPTIQLGLIIPPKVEEVKALIERAVADGDYDLATLIFVAAAIGARRGELAGIILGAIDWARRQITIRQTVADVKGVEVRPGTKTKDIRVVAFAEDTEAVLMDQAARAERRCRSRPLQRSCGASRMTTRSRGGRTGLPTSLSRHPAADPRGLGRGGHRLVYTSSMSRLIAAFTCSALSFDTRKAILSPPVVTSTLV